MTIGLLLDMAVEGHGQRVAVGSRTNGLTYRELRTCAHRGANWFHSQGFDRVVYLAPNGIPYPAAFFAASAAQIPFVPMNYRLGRRQLHGLLNKQGRALALVDAARPAPVDDMGIRVMSTDEWLALTAESPGREALTGHANAPAVGDPDEVAVVLYTSGTSAEPKAALLRHRHLTSYVFGSVEFGSADAHESTLVAVPPYHVAGISNILSSVFSGRRMVPLPQFAASAWLDLAEREHVTHAFVVPTMLARIVEDLKERQVGAAPGLRTLAYGGSRMPRPVIEQALRMFPTTDFVNAYGLTETSSTIAVLGPEEHRLALRSTDPKVGERLSSAGRPLPGVEVQIRGADGSPLDTDAVGEIFVRGPQVAGEYAQQQAALDVDGWFDTRDRGRLDADGYLFVEGRADDTIIRGGENIAPAEIEDVLMHHPDVLEAAVVPLPDQEWGDLIAAVVVVRNSDLDPEVLAIFCRDHLRRSKTPDHIEIWAEIPRTDTGKVLRREITEALEANLVSYSG